MKEVRGLATTSVPVGLPRCFTLLAAVEQYPRWVGEYVHRVQVLRLDQSGYPEQALATVHVPQSTFAKDFQLALTIEASFPEALRLTRIPEHSEDQDRLDLLWRLKDGEGTTLSLQFVARISFLPSFLPVGDVGDTIAEAVLDAAVGALEDGLPEAHRVAGPRA